MRSCRLTSRCSHGGMRRRLSVFRAGEAQARPPLIPSGNKLDPVPSTCNSGPTLTFITPVNSFLPTKGQKDLSFVIKQASMNEIKSPQ